MNLKRRIRPEMPKQCLEDAKKLDELWCEMLSRHDGPFLFGDWSIADAFSTPYATRFISYNIPRSNQADTYISELMGDEDYLEWEMEALGEEWVEPKTDMIYGGG